ncbi:MAG: VOC family protein [Pyrinomonadaceae bacterium]
MRSEDAWPNGMAVAQVRVARPTDKLEEVVRFYGDGLGLIQIGSFHGHAGYDGVMFGLPGRDCHLEFTAVSAGAGSQGLVDGDEVSTACDSGRATIGDKFAAPSKDNLLVLYLPDRAAIDRIAEKLVALGYPAVEPENPYWAERGVTIEDPDGWRVVLMNTAGI